MTPDEYRQFCVVNSPASPVAMTHEQRMLLLCGLGIAGEGGEINDILKKWVFHGKPLGHKHLMEEAGDLLWYLDRLCWLMGWTMESIMEQNVNKLRARYPEGFKKLEATT